MKVHICVTEHPSRIWDVTSVIIYLISNSYIIYTLVRSSSAHKKWLSIIAGNVNGTGIILHKARNSSAVEPVVWNTILCRTLYTISLIFVKPDLTNAPHFDLIINLVCCLITGTTLHCSLKKCFALLACNLSKD